MRHKLCHAAYFIHGVQKLRQPITNICSSLGNLAAQLAVGILFGRHKHMDVAIVCGILQIVYALVLEGAHQI